MKQNDLNSPAKPVGIGIDLVKIEEIKELDERTSHSFTLRTFTEKERLEAAKASDPYEYYAGRYAVKEAVFKAIVSRCGAPFDFRTVETGNDETGKPYVVMNPDFRTICTETGVDDILISISHEAGFAIAVAQAIGK